jgi:hypothetical protein
MPIQLHLQLNGLHFLLTFNEPVSGRIQPVPVQAPIHLLHHMRLRRALLPNLLLQLLMPVLTVPTNLLHR